MPSRKLSAPRRDELIAVLKARFEKNRKRHEGIAWPDVEAKLKSNAAALWSLHEMERTGGEPDVIGREGKAGAFIFMDCSAESPKGRRRVCYDQEALEKRKEHKPGDSALNMAGTMGVELLDEQEYRHLQELGEFDTKTSSWVKTPADIRKRGGAIFCDRRYDHVFTYHNGAESYYAARGFRCVLKV